jgi:hypothetical protein
MVKDAANLHPRTDTGRTINKAWQVATLWNGTPILLR